MTTTTTTQTHRVNSRSWLNNQTAAFDGKVREMLGIKGRKTLSELDNGGVIYYVVPCGQSRLLISVNQFGKAMDVWAYKGGYLRSSLREAIRNLGGQDFLLPMLNIEHLASFRSDAEGLKSKMFLRDLMNELKGFLPRSSKASFIFVPYEVKGDSDAGFTLNAIFETHVLVGD